MYKGQNEKRRKTSLDTTEYFERIHCTQCDRIVFDNKQTCILDTNPDATRTGASDSEPKVAAPVSWLPMVTVDKLAVIAVSIFGPDKTMHLLKQVQLPVQQLSSNFQKGCVLVKILEEQQRYDMLYIYRLLHVHCIGYLLILFLYLYHYCFLSPDWLLSPTLRVQFNYRLKHRGFLTIN